MSIGNDRLFGRNSASPRRAAGPLLAFAVALLFGATAGHSQWLETKITLPDSLGGALLPCCLTTDTSERYVYVGAQGFFDQGGGVYVVDAEARSRVAKIPSVSISAVCSNTRRNKVYAADSARNRVLAISCATNQVVATISTGTTPLALCYNSIDDKVYAVNYDSDDLTVIDCLMDSVIKTIHTGDRPVSICYNPASNRVFCAAHDTLLVIDGASDSIVAGRAGSWPGPLVVNAPANRVYASNSGVGLMVLDGATGEVLDTMISGYWMCLNSHTQKLYTLDNNDVRIFDCTADTLIKAHRVFVWVV